MIHVVFSFFPILKQHQKKNNNNSNNQHQQQLQHTAPTSPREESQQQQSNENSHRNLPSPAAVAAAAAAAAAAAGAHPQQQTNANQDMDDDVAINQVRLIVHIAFRFDPFTKSSDDYCLMNDCFAFSHSLHLGEFFASATSEPKCYTKRSTAATIKSTIIARTKYRNVRRTTESTK